MRGIRGSRLTAALVTTVWIACCVAYLLTHGP